MTPTIATAFRSARTGAPALALGLLFAADAAAQQWTYRLAHPEALHAAYAEGLQADGSESPRMRRAKDLISDDRWVAAIAELRGAVADPREEKKDEALFWLAHSQNQAGDLAEAVESVQRLQREHAKSRWIEPAYSLLIELAQKLGRQDVLWRLAPPPVPPATPAVAGPRPRPASPPAAPPRPPHPAPAPLPAAVPPVPPGTPLPPAAAPAPVPAAPPVPWVIETYHPDADVRVQALGRLLRTDAEKVIPMLGHIAFEADDPGAARRAVFVLAASRNPEAQSVVVDLARRGPEPVRIAAVRELARFGGEGIAQQLLEVYSDAGLPVKQQVVISLGQRSDTDALFRIAEGERNVALRERAIISLGRAGGREQLRTLYRNAPPRTRSAIVRGLFNARDDEGLIRLAEQEKDEGVRREIVSHLRLMGTAKSIAYLEKLR